ncbi:MAG: hypothetical protein Q9227_004854 [Pyrenula ochraceoflavens]
MCLTSLCQDGLKLQKDPFFKPNDLVAQLGVISSLHRVNKEVKTDLNLPIITATNTTSSIDQILKSSQVDIPSPETLLESAKTKPKSLHLEVSAAPSALQSPPPVPPNSPLPNTNTSDTTAASKMSNSAAPVYDFLLHVPDFPKMGPVRMANIQAHMAHNKPLIESDRIVVSGPTLKSKPVEGAPLEMNGSVMIIRAGSEEEVWGMVKEDPMCKAGVWDLDRTSVKLMRCAVRKPM